jgi:hypothetical protein
MKSMILLYDDEFKKSSFRWGSMYPGRSTAPMIDQRGSRIPAAA